MHEAIHSSGEKLELPSVTREQLVQKLQEAGVWSDKIEQALEQVRQSHILPDGQPKPRDSGQPYLDEHIFPIALDVLDYFHRKKASKEELELVVVAALLHDAIEDDKSFTLEKCEHDFGLDVSKLVYSLTKYEQQVTYRGVEIKEIEHDLYISKLMNADERAQIIKCFDRINNLKCSAAIVQGGNAPKELIDKLVDYTYETYEYYLPLANQLLNKTIYDKMLQVVGICNALIENLGRDHF